MIRPEVSSSILPALVVLLLFSDFRSASGAAWSSSPPSPTSSSSTILLSRTTTTTTLCKQPRDHHLDKPPPRSSSSSLLLAAQNDDDDNCGGWEKWTVSTNDQDENDMKRPSRTPCRRSFLSTAIASSVVAMPILLTSLVLTPFKSNAAAPSTTADAVITDKIYLEFKGLSSPSEENDSSPSRIVIGLFGNDAPQPVSILKQLASSNTGLPSKCKPREIRTLQREQLEANKVYNSCIETEDKGVTYDYSSIWRVDKDRRIDVGAVSGKFVSRINPTFEDTTGSGGSGLKHDAPGVVSVRKGNDGGFGFTIYPGGGDSSSGTSPTELNEDNIVVGRIVEGLDVMKQMNDLPVVQSSSVNYMSLTGASPKGKSAPSRACRYGGPMYCNELKPLRKVLVTKVGVL